MKSLILAFSFLTTIPMPTLPFVPGGLGKSARFYTLVGLVLGVILVALNQLMSPFQFEVRAVLLVVAWVMLTGGLHLDGFADCCDGLLASVSAEKRLDIMKDPRNGTFAVCGLILILMVKAGALVSILRYSGDAPAIIAATVFSRWLILPVAKLPMARAGGLGTQFSTELTPLTIFTTALIPAALIPIFGVELLFMYVAAVAVTGALALLAYRRIGGVSGDVFGMVVESAEAVILLTALI